jgi:hypothetical protein
MLISTKRSPTKNPLNKQLNPSLRGLDLPRHVGELGPDNGVLDKELAERLALVGPFEGLGVGDTGREDGARDGTDTFAGNESLLVQCPCLKFAHQLTC